MPCTDAGRGEERELWEQVRDFMRHHRTIDKELTQALKRIETLEAENWRLKKKLAEAVIAK
jgi:cell shape-determining protein MreC